jgi:hypothetical protein
LHNPEFAGNSLSAPWKKISVGTPCCGIGSTIGDAMKRTAIIAAALIAASSLSLTLAPNSARAQMKVVAPPPPQVAHVPAWWWAGFACPASVVLSLSAVVADFRDNRQLTAPEAWTCGLLHWVPMPVQPKPAGHKHH